ncbi:N-6 DNA methylase [Tateyamaria sp. syn59]|uniref:N-6 DNA methylase n=1 Tax=Tateyamaria sp. syn59 TaxID=2576942 RepID=UPI001CB9466F|nr:N-6 DNA methylase [Tateyamaria sp. syn59]
MAEALQGASKSGAGAGVPEAILVDPDVATPLVVIEAKASEDDLAQAIIEAEGYGAALVAAGYRPLAVGLAGTEADAFGLRVSKWDDDARGWVPVTYEGHPIDWIPNETDVRRITARGGPADIRPTPPPAEVLAEKADDINRLLREADIKDEFRPTAVAAFMLALWHSRGELRRDPKYVLKDVNEACGEAFAKAGKLSLSKSITVDAANLKLRQKAGRILTILERLNVTVLTAEHDYLGQLYETFFRYTGGNTIGQYFTPRHVARMMVDACEAGSNDVVADLACGTGGFFVAYMSRLVEVEHLPRTRMVEVIQENILGFEAEPSTAALCVANMILRGDGSTKIRQADSLGRVPDFPEGMASIALMNPPFPHKNTDTPVERFIERGLESLRDGGKMAVVVPASLLSKGGKAAKWRASILKKHTLTAVCQLPDELFQPFASVTTSIIFLEKGRAHNPARKTAFVRLHHDGLVLRKSVRVHRNSEPNQIPAALDAIANKTETAGFSAAASVSGEDEWSAGAYIASAVPEDDELRYAVDVQLRRLASFYTRYAAEIVAQREAIDAGDIVLQPYREMLTPIRISNAAKLPSNKGTIGGTFDIYYGLKELHSREGIAPGRTLIISPTENYNGTYGWLEFPVAANPSFVTVAQTGSIGEAFVQLEPCAVNDDCLVLLPKDDGIPDLVTLVLTAATLHAEKWRFNYGRKLTPSRIAHFRMPTSRGLENWVADRLDDMMDVVSASLTPYQKAVQEEKDMGKSNNGRLSMYGFDPKDALRAFMQVDPEAVKRRENQMRENRSEDDIDAEDAHVAMDEPRTKSLSEIRKKS